MLDNLTRRLGIWLGRQDWYFRYLGWDHKRTTRKRREKTWNITASDD